jgi:hypothetical protein
MAQIAYRANLSSAIYPMTIADGGRTVIIPGPDQNFDRRVDPAGEQKDAGIPQALYLENVMPTVNGYQSVSFLAPTSRTMTVPAGASYIKFCIETPAGLEGLPGPGIPAVQITVFPIFVWDNDALSCGIFGDKTVTYTGTAATNIQAASVTVIAGISYLFLRTTVTNYLYEVVRDVNDNIVLINVTSSVTPPLILDSFKSITSSNNYLIGHDLTTIYYSSTTSPLDFVSSLVSGAGQIDPNSSENLIQYVKETTNGFYVYCATNTLIAQYTGNARYPWKFMPVMNSTGRYEDYNWCTAGGADTPGHYVIEKNKNLKFIQNNQATAVAPEVSDFLGKNPLQELFDYATNTFIRTTANTSVPSIYIYMNRYVIVSINGTAASGAANEKYTHAIVFDTVLSRYGKLKIDHSFLFTVAGPRETLAFVNKQSRAIRYLSFDIYQTEIPFVGLSWQPATGVLILGKFQYVRSRKIQLHEIQVEGPQNTAIVPSPNFSCVLFPSLEGRKLDDAVPLTASLLSDGLAIYPVHNTAQNHSICLKGAFNVNTLQLKFSPRGDR